MKRDCLVYGRTKDVDFLPFTNFRLLLKKQKLFLFLVCLQILIVTCAATPIQFGETVTGTLSTIHQTDSYTFTGTAGDPVIIRMKSNWIWYPEIRLYAPDGTLLMQVNTSEYVNDIVTVLPATGTYMIQALDREGDNTGTYSLFLQRTKNPGNPFAISYGDTKSGGLIKTAQMDSYTFNGTVGDPVIIRMKSNWIRYPEIRLYAPDGTLLKQANTSEYVNDYITVLPETGTYLILVLDREGDNTGMYSLYLQRTKNPGNPFAISYGDTKSGGLTKTAQMDSYTFTGTAGDPVIIRMKSNWIWYPEIRLYAPDGTLLKQVNNSEYVNDIVTVLPETGTYLILALDREGDNTGIYSLFLQRTKNPGNLFAISYGDTRSGVLTKTAQMDSYTFNGTVGDPVIIRMKSNWIWYPEIRLYAPDGTLLKQVNNSEYVNDIVTVLPETGTYLILALDREGDNTGIYSLFLQRTKNPGNPFTISYCDTKSGGLTKTAQMDSYTFTGTAGDPVVIRMKSNWIWYPEIRLYAPDGTLLKQVNTTEYVNEIVTVLPETGTYLILALDREGDNTGNYTLNLHRAPSALPGYAIAPTDPDKDGIYEDLNGNGRLDFADVVLYFNQMEWIAANEPVCAFDLNANGRIDFADIVKLFGEI